MLRLLQHDPRLPDGLAGNQVTSLLQDQAGWVWVGGFGLGLQRHNPANQAFRVRSADQDPGSPLADADVRALLQFDTGEIWAASQTTGVAVMDSALRVIGQLPTDSAGKPAALQVQAMAQAADGSVWLAAGNRLQQRDRQQRLLQTLTLPVSPARALRTAADGNLWIATQDGLFRLAPGATLAQRLVLDNGQPLLGEVNALALAPDDALWVGSGAGLDRLAPGHAADDAVLVQMRDQLLQVFRDSDHIVRWGGEEFLVVARGTDQRHAPDLAERARLAIGHQPFVLPDGTHLHKTCSIGFVAFPLAPALPRALGWNQAIIAADAALYAAKHAGRDSWVGLVSARAEHDNELLALLQRPAAERLRLEALQLLRSQRAEDPAAPGESAP